MPETQYTMRLENVTLIPVQTCSWDSSLSMLT